MKRIILVAILGAVAFGFQEAPEGTAESCNNYHDTKPVHKCNCAKAMMCGRGGSGSAEPDSKCKTYCRPDHCHCVGPCTSRTARVNSAVSRDAGCERRI